MSLARVVLHLLLRIPAGERGVDISPTQNYSARAGPMPLRRGRSYTSSHRHCLRDQRKEGPISPRHRTYQWVNKEDSNRLDLDTFIWIEVRPNGLSGQPVCLWWKRKLELFEGYDYVGHKTLRLQKEMASRLVSKRGKSQAFNEETLGLVSCKTRDIM